MFTSPSNCARNNRYPYKVTATNDHNKNGHWIYAKMDRPQVDIDEIENPADGTLLLGKVTWLPVTITCSADSNLSFMNAIAPIAERQQSDSPALVVSLEGQEVWHLLNPRLLSFKTNNENDVELKVSFSEVRFVSLAVK